MSKPTEIVKSCSTCAHYDRPASFGNDICNLYNKYCLTARIHCKMECWQKKSKKDSK